mmetsp:Transcript_25992/g.51803  ORF Transcript_25992/g.51803 Transcript_25992/m.51803 type:complete len:87 (-) Transcript_25992:293-553(-)
MRICACPCLFERFEKPGDARRIETFPPPPSMQGRGNRRWSAPSVQRKDSRQQWGTRRNHPKGSPPVAMCALKNGVVWRSYASIRKR